MLRDFEIVKEKVATTFIGNDGNLHFHKENYRFFLKDEDDEIISHQYYCMIFLGDDHFAICDIINDIRFSSDYNYYDIVKGDYEMATPKMKWGVMRLNRNNEGKIIPKGETMIISPMYDRISENNLKTATAFNCGNLTYLDIDRDSSSYGQQLVPCLLSHAGSFDIEYDGFAQCSINGVVRYLPRNCKDKETIEIDDLLTETQALCVSKYLNGSDDYLLDNKTISAYFNLTGERLVSEKRQQLKKTIKQQRSNESGIKS